MKDPRSGNAGPVGLALTAMASIQVGAALAKEMFGAVGPEGAVTLRVVLATAIMMVLLRPWRSSIAWREWRLALPYGAALGLMNLCFYSALRTVPLGMAVALEFTGPLALAVITSHRWLDLLWVALAVLGIGLMHMPDGAGGIEPVGGLFALSAGVFWALYIVFGKRASALGSARAAALGLAVAMLVVVPVGVTSAGWRLLDMELLPRALAVAVLSSALPYTLEMVALRRLPQRTFGILMSVGPAMAALFGFVMLGEHLSGMQYAAIVCVIAASLGSVASIGRKTARASICASP
jgi:inner membrane transporter RhtA